MFDQDVSAAGEGDSIALAILSIINDPETEDGCAIGDLLDLLDLDEKSVWDGVLTLIATGRAYVTSPLARADLDTFLMPVQWCPGTSTSTDIAAIFGAPHVDVARDGVREIIYDLYVEDPEEPNYPSPPAPYAAREEGSNQRPAACTVPFSPIWPPEALQVKFVFDGADLLAGYQFTVGHRAT